MKIFRSIAGKMKRLLSLFPFAQAYFLDFLRYIKYSISLGATSQEQKKTILLLLLHSLEKGMSFANKRHGYGKDKAKALLEGARDYSEKYGNDDALMLAMGVLNEYFNDPYASKDDALMRLWQQTRNIGSCLTGDSCGGVKELIVPTDNISYDAAYSLFATRSSVRVFKDQKIANDDLRKAVQIAALTPTACNRQPCKIYSVLNDETKLALIDNQLGNQGWCNNAPNLFVVSASLSSFGGVYERYQAYIDGGLFAMNFVMGLHACGIASCFKMYVRDPARDAVFRDMIGMPDNEDPIVLVFAGYYSDNPSMVPQSVRWDLEHLLKDVK